MQYRKLTPFFYIFPALLGVTVFIFYPLLYGLILSFSEIKFVPGGIILRYTGFENFYKIFTDARVPQIANVTIGFVVITVIGTILLSLVAALFLNQDFKGKKIALILCLIPWAIPRIASGEIWKWLLNGSYGLIGTVLMKLGQPRIVFLADPNWAFFWVSFVEIWIGFPYTLLLFLSGLQFIPPNLYEAALIDGAGKIRRFWNITLPLLKPVFLFALIQRIIWNIKAFAAIYMLTGGGPYNATTVYYYYIWTQTFEWFNFGYGAALAYFFTIFLTILAIFYIKFSLKSEYK